MRAPDPAGRAGLTDTARLAADLAGTAVLFGLDALARRVPRHSSRTAALAAALLFFGAGARAQQTPAAAPTPAISENVVVSATAEAEATLESFRELNSRRMREMLAHVDAADLAVVEHALRILDAAVAADVESTTIDPQGDQS